MSDDDFSRDEGQPNHETLAPVAFASHPVSEGSATCRVTPNKSLPILPLLNEATANELLTPRFAVPEPRQSTSESGQFLAASHGSDAADAHPKTIGDGHQEVDDLAHNAIDARSLSETAGHVHAEHLILGARLSTPSDAIRAALSKDIREAYHKRRDLMEAEKRLTLQIKALCRREVGGDLKLAGDLYAEIDKQAFTTPEAEALYQHAEPLLHARSYISKAKKLPEKELTKMAKALGLNAFVDSINGFGYLGLAQIIGEAGDLSNYANPGKLWRRMGLAPYKGKALSMWRMKGGLSAEGWEDAGYCPRRRSTMYVLGDSLIKKPSEYRELYLSRKAYEAEKAPDLPKMAHHRRALRYMEKRLLRNLWRAWRDLGGEAIGEQGPRVEVPHPQPFCDAEAAPVLSPTLTELPHRTPSMDQEANRYLAPTRGVLPVLPIESSP